MPKFPEPPPVASLESLPPIVRRVDAGTLLWRIYFQDTVYQTKWNTFRYFGPTASRFDHHEEPEHDQDRGILYSAVDGGICFAECFQETRTIDVHRHGPLLVGFKLAHSLDLLDLTSNWPTRAGTSMAINSGQRPRARRWARAIYAAYPSLHGLWYASSMGANEPAQALFERAKFAMPGVPVIHRRLADPELEGYVRRVARRFGYVVV